MGKKLMKPEALELDCHNVSINESVVAIDYCGLTKEVPIRYVTEVLDFLELNWKYRNGGAKKHTVLKCGMQFTWGQDELCECYPNSGIYVAGFSIDTFFESRSKHLFNWLVDCERWLYQEGLLK